MNRLKINLKIVTAKTYLQSSILEYSNIINVAKHGGYFGRPNRDRRDTRFIIRHSDGLRRNPFHPAIECSGRYLYSAGSRPT